MKSAVFTAEIPAKVNLSLAITGRKDTLHTLEMVVCPYFGYVDTVEFIPSESTNGIAVTATADFDNFDEKRFFEFFKPKADIIAEKFGVSGKLIIKKGIPLGAGLGGSSASVVGALETVRKYTETLGKSVPLDNRFLLQLGSDVPCMLYGKPCLVSGVGEIITPIDIPINPDCLDIQIAGGGSDTKACYALYDALKQNEADKNGVSDTDNVYCIKLSDGRQIKLFVNDLTAPAVILNPEIGKLISEMRRKYRYTVMSGSGSAVVGYRTIVK